MSDLTREYLQALLKPEAWGVANDADGSPRYPDGTEWDDPTTFPVHLRRLLGPRVQIFGFWAFENPAADRLLEVAERHDFAVVDQRWILDPWTTGVRDLASQGITDRRDASDSAAKQGIYGNAECWERSHHLESYADCQSTPTSSPSASGAGFELAGFDMA